jgi:predicted RNA binding protein YcfA (HicA-like mRNA interferase family)
MKVRDVIKRLEQDGWRIARRAAIGNSITRRSQGPFTVAGHSSVDIPPGTLNNILKQAGLN